MAGHQPPDLIPYREFKNLTTHRNPLKRGRNNLGPIDEALRTWHNGVKNGTNLAKVTTLRALTRHCAAWITRKSQTSPDSGRLVHVKALGQQALELLKYELFEKHKFYRGLRTAGLHGGPNHLKPLGPGYQRERETYLHSGKTRALAGGFVHQSWSGFKDRAQSEGIPPSQLVGMRPEILQLLYSGKSFENFTFIEYMQVESAFGQGPGSLTSQVTYKSKDERRVLMTVLIDGLFYRDMVEGPYTTKAPGGNGLAPAMYAIDDYGNFFVQREVDELENGRPAFFNHSSFASGKPVICAGTCTIDSGRLKYIDNSSGHYKPTRENLYNAVEMLRRDGVNVDDVNVAVFGPLPGGGELRWQVFKGRHFASWALPIAILETDWDVWEFQG